MTAMTATIGSAGEDGAQNARACAEIGCVGFGAALAFLGVA